MALDILTWLIASIAVLLGYLTVAKFASEPNEKQIIYAQPQNPEENQTPQQLQVNPNLTRIQAQRKPTPPHRESNQQSRENAMKESQKQKTTQNPVEREEPAAKEKEQEESEPPPTITHDLENLAKEIQNLKTLLKMSQELREELEKLAEILKTNQTSKRVN